MLPVLTALAAATLAASYTGAILPAGDALAAGRLHLVLAVILLGALTWGRGRRPADPAWRRNFGAMAVFAALVSGADTLRVFLPAGTASARAEAAVFRLYQKNLLGHAWPRRPLADEIVASGAEIVTLQEVTDHNRRFMGAMWQAYATQVVCDTGHLGSVAILSHWPVQAGTEDCGSGYALARLAPPGAPPLWVVAVHLRWPWPADDQDGQSRALAERIAGLEGPVMVSGDFNMQPWGASVTRLGRAARARPVRPAIVTFPGPAPWVPLSIDHVFLPGGWNGQAEVRPLLGSDHLGLLVSVSRPG